MKRVVTIGILTWVALWPLGHRTMVAVYDVNPWKLGGFAMYTTPTPPIQVVAFETTAGGLAPLDERELPEAARRVLRRFRVERHALGELRRPDDLGRSLLDARPDLERVVIAVQRMILDPDSARMTSKRRQYVIERPE